MHRFSRLLPITTGAILFHTKTAYCDAGMTVPYVEPISHVTFPPESFTKLPDLSQNLQLVSAGVRCMLGDSHMCDRPITRVYSYGLYIDPKVFESNSIKPEFDELLFSSPEIPKTITIFVTVTKDVGHWYGGFRKTIGRRFARIQEYADNKKVRDSARKARKKWTSMFLNKDIFPKQVPHGTIIEITWHKEAVTTYIDGKKMSTIKNNILGEAIFRTYFGGDSVNPKVNQRTRDHYEHGMTTGEVQKQEFLKKKGACPALRRCGKRLSFASISGTH